MRGFLSEPEEGDKFAEELVDILDARSGRNNRLAQEWLSELMPRLQTSPAKAIALISGGTGKGAVVRLPLSMEELKAIINSPAERALNIFRHRGVAYLLTYTGTAMNVADSGGAVVLHYGLSRFLHSNGHSHPRFHDTELSLEDEEARRAQPDIDHFVLALVDWETIEVSLWRANAPYYQTERGTKAEPLLFEIGLLSRPRRSRGSGGTQIIVNLMLAFETRLKSMMKVWESCFFSTNGTAPRMLQRDLRKFLECG